MATEKIETKEDIKKVIDKSTDYGELYKNSQVVLKRMESSFKDTLKKVAWKEWWAWEKQRMINYSIFDDRLNTSNPITMFEKKWAELLRRSKDIAENNKVLNAWIQLYKKLWWERLDQKWKDLIVEELFSTRLSAIQDFKNDISDGILSNVNNVDITSAISQWRDMWRDIFRGKEDMQKEEFEDYINKMSLPRLIFGTFCIDEWSWAFKYCYGKIKEKLRGKNLFDFIDSQKKAWNHNSELLKYSAFKSLFGRKQITDLEWWISTYSGNKQVLLNYISQQIKNDRSFKIAFLTWIKECEKSSLLWVIAKNLKNKDLNVRKAYEATWNLNNIDIFNEKKVDGLMIYDNEWHWGGSAFFQSELQVYKNQGFSISQKEENWKYIKYVLKKWSDSITMLQLKMDGARSEKDEFDVQTELSSLCKWKNYNLFALRGHCYNTSKMARALGKIGAIWEWDVLIDWGCWNASKSSDYYQSWVKGHIFAYTSEWRWASTQAFINKIIATKNSWNKFSDILDYYNTLNASESSADWYFAYNVERPDSVASQYKRITW